MFDCSIPLRMRSVSSHVFPRAFFEQHRVHHDMILSWRDVTRRYLSVQCAQPWVNRVQRVHSIWSEADACAGSAVAFRSFIQRVCDTLPKEAIGKRENSKTGSDNGDVQRGFGVFDRFHHLQHGMISTEWDLGD